MHSARLLAITFLTFLAGCPDTMVDLSTGSTSDEFDTDSASSTSAPELTTSGNSGDALPVPGFDCNDPWQLDDASLPEFCFEHPFARAAECADQPPVCADMIPMLAGTPACAAVTLCDYKACAADLAVAACDEVPESCKAIESCLMPAPEPTCCDVHGEIPGTGLCWASLDLFCVDCNGGPALCMTEGCGSAGVEDCCLSDAGETVPCPPPVCSAGFCDDFAEVAEQSGLDPEFAEELEKVCKWNPCFACGEVVGSCPAGPTCGSAEKCEAEMRTCDCG